MNFVRRWIHSKEERTQPEPAGVVVLDSIRPIESKLSEVHKAEGRVALGRAAKKGWPDTIQGKIFVT